MTQPVLTEVTDGVGVLTLNRPAAKNAVDLATAQALAAALDEFEARDDIAVLVLTGAGGTFCAGMDLKAFARGERPRIEGRAVAGRTEAQPAKPRTAPVGGGGLALSAGLIVPPRDARFGIPEVKRCLFAAGGGVLRLAKALPYQRAMEMAPTGDPLPAEGAPPVRFG